MNSMITKGGTVIRTNTVYNGGRLVAQNISGMITLISYFEEHVRSRGPVQTFHLAATVRPGSAGQETDLFAGVSEKD
jgi:hypothetical protein